MALISEQQARTTLNLGLHVIVLSAFLFAAFYMFLAQITENIINTQVKDGIDDHADVMLDKIANKLGKHVNWNEVDTWAQNLVKKSQGRDPVVVKHNNGVLNYAIGIIAGMLGVWIGTAALFRYWMGYDIALGSILAENAVVFAIVGTFEGYFFMSVATKYVPLSASVSATTALERVKEQLSQHVTDDTPTVSSQMPSPAVSRSGASCRIPS